MNPPNLTLRPNSRRWPLAWSAAFCAVCALGVSAAPAQAQGGKLVLTGGVSSIDGAAGGGLSPWAVIGTPATEGQWGATAFVTTVRTRDYALQVQGAALAWNDRLELSLARQDLNARDNLAALGLRGLHLKQDIAGLKLRLAGDAVLDSDTLMPQIAVGWLHKSADPAALGATLSGALGARLQGNEFYLSASKLFLAQGLLLNGTLRATQANQNGLLGFGGANAGKSRLWPELSVVWLLSRQLALGAEVRFKPDNLNQSALGAGALKEDRWADVFVAWAPSPQLSLTLAWVDLGRIAPAVQPRRQTGAYLSLQVGI